MIDATSYQEKNLFSEDFEFREDCYDVAFRLDYYSRKDFLEKFQSLIENILGNSFSERLLTEEESIRINLESVSSNLGNSFNEIKERRVFIFSWKGDENDNANQCKIYVSPYFMFIYGKGDKIDLIKIRIESLLSILAGMHEDISVSGIRFASRYQLMVAADAIRNSYFGMHYYKDIPFNQGISQEYRFRFDDEKNENIVNISSRMEMTEVEDGEKVGNLLIDTTSYKILDTLEDKNIPHVIDRLIASSEKFMRLCAE